MSDSSVSDLTRAVERLSLATDRLADRISSDSAPVVPPTITLRAKSRASDPDLSHLIVLALGNRGLEDGPCDLPSGVVDFCSSRITTRPPGVVARAGRAFNGVFGLGLLWRLTLRTFRNIPSLTQTTAIGLCCAVLIPSPFAPLLSVTLVFCAIGVIRS